jgi:DNA-binding NarL/FixJ family response regulator
MVHGCNERPSRPAVIVADAGEDFAARMATTIEQCGGDAIRLGASQNFESLVVEHEPALIIVDLDLPHPRFAITLVDLALQLSRAPVIVIGTSLEGVIAERAAAWESRCYWLQRPVHEGQLATTIRLALLRPRQAVPRGVPPLISPERRRLRPREREIAELLLNHYRVPAVAVRLSISAHTVRNHLKNIYRRWGVRSQQELLLALREVRGEGDAAPAGDGVQ